MVNKGPIKRHQLKTLGCGSAQKQAVKWIISIWLRANVCQNMR